MVARHLCLALHLKDKGIVPKSDRLVGQQIFELRQLRAFSGDSQKSAGLERKMTGVAGWTAIETKPRPRVPLVTVPYVL